MIALRNVSKTYGDHRAVDNVSFTANPGEIFGLLGPNGAGKTTAIRILMNILVPDGGEVVIFDRHMQEEDKARIGYLPEERGLYKKVKVRDMLSYLADLKEAPSSESGPRIDRWLERFELSEWADKTIDSLSKGMAQKVQFIGAVAHNPDLLFFDEPFSGLDPVSADALLQSLLDLKQQGKTILVSTHILEQAEKLCDRIFLIHNGREVLSGLLKDIKQERGKNTVAVEFSGDPSVFERIRGATPVVTYPRYIELELAEGTEPDSVLRAAMGSVSIQRFEVKAPSLHQIFVQEVGQSIREIEDQE
ncbi:MAG: ABC transporter ATP-binding protein [Spirochaetota bacterium]